MLSGISRLARDVRNLSIPIQHPNSYYLSCLHLIYLQQTVNVQRLDET